MKRIVVLILAVLMLFSMLIACTNSSIESAERKSTIKENTSIQEQTANAAATEHTNKNDTPASVADTSSTTAKMTATKKSSSADNVVSAEENTLSSVASTTKQLSDQHESISMTNKNDKTKITTDKDGWIDKWY